MLPCSRTKFYCQAFLEPISKMSFGPISFLVPRFPALLDSPSDLILSVGHKSEAVALVPSKPLGEDGILNQNPIFEMGFEF